MTYKVFMERHKGDTGLRSDTPTLTVGPEGQITLNKASMEALNYPSRVRLLWDADARRFGLEATTADDRNGYSVQRQQIGYSCGQLHPRAFWGFIGHKPSGETFAASLDDNGILSTCLDDSQRESQ